MSAGPGRRVQGVRGRGIQMVMFQVARQWPPERAHIGHWRTILVSVGALDSRDECSAVSSVAPVVSPGPIHLTEHLPDGSHPDGGSLLNDSLK